jgi:hypothetical protein
MTAGPQDQFDRAKRRQKQKQHLLQFRAGLDKAVGFSGEPQLYELEEALALLPRLYAKLRQLRASGELRVKDGLDAEQFETTAKNTLEMDGHATFLVYLCHWEHMGALVLAGGELAVYSRKLLEFDGDTVTACNRDLTRIVSFDRRLEVGRGVLFEVDDWGKTGKD